MIADVLPSQQQLKLEGRFDSFVNGFVRVRFGISSALAPASPLKADDILVVANHHRLTWSPKTMQAITRPFFATVLPYSV